MPNFLQPHGMQYARLPCPLLSPRVCSNACPWSQWCHLTVTPSGTLFSCLQSFPESGVFSSEQLLTLDGQSIGASASGSVLPKNTQGWFPWGLTSLISLQSKGLSRVFSSTIVQKHQFFGSHPSLLSNTHICTWLLETTFLTIWNFFQQSSVSRNRGLSLLTKFHLVKDMVWDHGISKTELLNWLMSLILLCYICLS